MVERFHSITPSLPVRHLGTFRGGLKNQQPVVTHDMGNKEEAIECTLKDTLTAKNGDVSSLTP